MNVVTQYVNIALELIGVLLYAVIFIALMLGYDRQARITRLFLCILACGAAVLLSDALALTFRGKPGLYENSILYIANFCNFAFGYILAAIFTEYLVEFIREKKRISKRAARAAWLLCAVAIGLLVVSQFNGMYYRIDENNFYRRQDWFWLSQSFGLIILLLNAVLLYRHRKCLNRRSFFALSTYILLPALALLFAIFYYGVVLLYIAEMLSIIIIYMEIQIAQTNAHKQTELALAESRIAIMLSQIHPHFLYNALSSISYLCDTDSKKAKQAISEFSQYLRCNLDSLSVRAPVPFEKELNHVKTYLSLEKMRFGDALQVDYDITVTDFYIPCLTVQPLVENAVRYGLGQKEEGGTLCVTTLDAGAAIAIAILDDGVGFDPAQQQKDTKSHIGIQNVRERLSAQCGGTLVIYSEPGKGTRAIITIPKEMGAL